MGKFNLNNSIDFARATNSFGSSIVSLFTGRGDSSWVLDEGTYQSGVTPGKQVIFHVFRSAQDYGGALSQISDSGGRRKAKFAFPYLDGQLTEDMGRKAETFSLDIVLHGNNYLDAFNNLMSILNEPTPGVLIHPIRGKITCALEDYQVLHEEKSRKAVAIQLTMTEHSTDGISLLSRKDKSAPSKLSKLAQVFKKIDTVINKVQGTVFLVQSVKNTIIQGLEALQASFASISSDMNSTFNAGGNIPALLPVQLGGTLDANGNVVTSSTNIAISPADPFINLPASLTNQDLQTALALEQISKIVTNVRAEVATNITALSAAGNNRGAHEFFDNIIDLRVSANDLLEAFEAGKASSRIKTIKFTTLRVMSVREVAFENGLSPNDSIQIALLNPELESLNLIPSGTILKVAVS